MGASAGPRRGLHSSINVTPLVDVVLVLLIIFMVVTPLMRKAKLELPSASELDRGPAAEVTVSMQADRQLLWEQTPISVEALRSRVRMAPRTAVTLKADASLAVDDVRPVLAAIRDAGAAGVRFAVQAPDHH